MQVIDARSPERETVNIEEAARRLGIDRGSAYKLAKQGQLPVPVIHIGRRMVVPRAALDHALCKELNDVAPPPSADPLNRLVAILAEIAARLERHAAEETCADNEADQEAA